MRSSQNGRDDEEDGGVTEGRTFRFIVRFTLHVRDVAPHIHDRNGIENRNDKKGNNPDSDDAALTVHAAHGTFLVLGDCQTKSGLIV